MHSKKEGNVHGANLAFRKILNVIKCVAMRNEL